jgi:hypothetical protein
VFKVGDKITGVRKGKVTREIYYYDWMIVKEIIPDMPLDESIMYRILDIITNIIPPFYGHTMERLIEEIYEKGYEIKGYNYREEWK